MAVGKAWIKAGRVRISGRRGGADTNMGARWPMRRSGGRFGPFFADWTEPVSRCAFDHAESFF
jgi:hypothetical protein